MTAPLAVAPVAFLQLETLLVAGAAAVILLFVFAMAIAEEARGGPGDDAAEGPVGESAPLAPPSRPPPPPVPVVAAPSGPVAAAEDRWSVPRAVRGALAGMAMIAALGGGSWFAAQEAAAPAGTGVPLSRQTGGGSDDTPPPGEPAAATVTHTGGRHATLR